MPRRIPLRYRLRRWLHGVNFGRLLLVIAVVFVLVALLVKGCMLAGDMPTPPPAPLLTSGAPLPAPSAAPASDISIKVYLHKTKRAETMPLETYILGVVSAEMPVSFHPEALKAQAVAARSFALSKMERPCNRGGADICTDSSHCQAWDDDASRRKKWGKQYEANLQKLTSAVGATAGEVVTYEGAVIQAFFHSTSGGMTENSENAFSSFLPYLRSVESLGEEDAPRYRGEVRVSRKNFVRTVNAKFPKARLMEKSLESQVEIVSTFESGRVESIRLGSVYARGRDMRSLFDLNSIHFVIIFQKNEVVIQTLGYGHGVGMSQTGANAMAARGADYVDILTHYYTGTRVEHMPSP